MKTLPENYIQKSPQNCWYQNSNHKAKMIGLTAKKLFSSQLLNFKVQILLMSLLILSTTYNTNTCKAYLKTQYLIL